jgi:pyruvate/2-oxoglutarate dehydrogenase complex dihydrolipoamide acyltransferase (E2) component
MPIRVLMPALSPTMEKAKLAKWFKRQGDKVKSGDIIAEIETDKCTMEYEAVDEGTLGLILVREGTADVPVNTPIAVILSEGEDERALYGFIVEAAAPREPKQQGKAAQKIFLSYRRSDSAGSTGRVHDSLEREFGGELLFMDVDSIRLGANFVRVLREEVGKCDVLLAFIGRGWLDAKDEDGHRRLDDPNDFVRVEIATALQRDIPVVPILLDDAKIPKARQLPDDLQELAVRNGMEVRHSAFKKDMEKLIEGLKQLLAKR